MRIFILFALLTISFSSISQEKLPELDKSPLDISYFPAGYPLLKIQGKTKDPLVARIVYSRPQKNERKIFGELIEYGKVWRLGANESTEIKLYKDVTFGDKLIKAGTYTMYAIPDKTEWTIIFNSKLDTWGAYSYEESKDVARIKVPAGASKSEVEAFAIWFDDKSMNIAWENTLVKVPAKS